MSLYYEREINSLKNLEEKKRSMPKEIWEVPENVWKAFDRSFTKRINETSEIFKVSNYQISREESVIIEGLLDLAGIYLNSIIISKTGKNEISIEGTICFNYDIYNPVQHCLKNDISNILSAMCLITDYDQKEKGEGFIRVSYIQIYDLLNKLKQLTTD